MQETPEPTDDPSHEGLEWKDVRFVPATRVTKYGPGNAELPEELRGWIRLSTPITQQLLTSPTEPYRFGHVRFALSLRPNENEPLECVWIKVKLESVLQGQPREAIAWSMQPQSEATSIDITTKLKLDGSFKLHGVGLGTGSETSQKTVQREIWAQAFNELTPEPIWELKSNAHESLKGSHRFQLVVRYTGESCAGRVDLVATVRKTRFGLVEYTAAIDELEFALFKLC